MSQSGTLRAGHTGGRLVGREPADRRSQVLDELIVHSLRRYADRVILVGDLPFEAEVSVLLWRSGDRVQLDHHLDYVAGAVLPGLRIYDHLLAVPLRDQIGPVRQRYRTAAEFEPVLRLDVYVEAADFPVGSSLIQERCVVEHTLGLIEVERDPGRVLEIDIETNRPTRTNCRRPAVWAARWPICRVIVGERPRRDSGDGTGVSVSDPGYFRVRWPHEGRRS